MFTQIFVKRPVLATCINLIILLAGIQAYYSITTRQYPKSDQSIVKVSTVYTGADASLVQGFITSILEKSIASADGIEYIESSSAQNLSTVSAKLKLNYDVNSALSQIQAKVNEVRGDLPPSAETPIIEVESVDNQFASMYLSFYSDILEENQISDFLTRVIQPKLSSIQGVQKAEILGGKIFAMRVWLDTNKIASLGLSPRNVLNAIKNNNFLAAFGSTKGSMIQVGLTSNSDLQSVEEFNDLVVGKSGNSLVKLSDIAKIELGAESYDELVKFGGKTAIFIGVYVLPNANSLEVIKDVRSNFDELEKVLPEDIEFGVAYDATEYIDVAIHEVIKTLAETIVIVIAVIYLFIGSLRSVLVPVVAIPLSLCGALGLMYLFGFTLNLLTLLAIVLAVGLVVDDAIVVLENVERLVDEGKSVLEAAMLSAKELFMPIVSMTVTLVAVYSPIGLQGGLTGALFKEFAFTLAGAVFISGFVAVTLSPMMSSKLVKKKQNLNKLQEKSLGFIEKLKSKYEVGLRWILNYKFAVIVFTLCFSMLILPLYLFSQKELAPREDQGVVFGIVQASPNSTLDQTAIYVNKLADLYKDFDEYKTSFLVANPVGGFSGMITKPWSKRSRTTEQVVPEMWGKVSKIPGINVIVTTPSPLPGGSNFPIEMVVSSTDDADELYYVAGELVKTAFASGLFIFAESSLKIDLPQAEIIFDKDKVAKFGLNLSDIVSDVGVLTSEAFANRFSIQGKSYKVIPQVLRNQRLNPQQLMEMNIGLADGTQVPLSTFAKIKSKTVPRDLATFNQLNAVTIQGAIPPGVSIDQALSVLESKAAEILPSSYVVDYKGESRQLRTEGNSFVVTFFMAVILIYLVLAAQFESFRDPFIILFGSVPLAIAGSLIFTFLGFTSMNIYSQVGLVTLVGLISKNGILIVEFANLLKQKGYSKYEAIIESSLTRMRPVLMTSAATMIGHFPLILASGAGAQARNSIGVVLVSGMFIGSFFTLFLVPVIYLFISSESSKEDISKDSKELGSKKAVNVLLLVSLLFALSGCVLVGDDYKKPELEGQEGFEQLEKNKQVFSSESVDIRWWENFDDPVLNEIIFKAVDQNLDLKQAVSRVNQARYGISSAFSELLPGFDLDTSYTKARNSGQAFPGGAQAFDFELYRATATTEWEIDLFGRLTRGVEASEARFDQSIADFRGVLLTLVSDVAASYFDLRGAQASLKVAKQNLEIQKQALEIILAKYEVGEATSLDKLSAEADYQQQESQIPLFEENIQKALYRLSVLLGNPPSKYLASLTQASELPIHKASLSVGQLPDLIKRRPDLQNAERNLAALTADVGVVEGNLYPKITLSGFVGIETREFDDFFRNPAKIFSWGPSITWNPLDNGKIRSAIGVSEEKVNEAYLDFQNKYYLAIEEVEKSLLRYSKEGERKELLEKAVSSAEEAYRVAKEQYAQGVIDFNTLLNRQKVVLDNRSSLINSKVSYSLSLVSIYKSLGGGWKAWDLKKE